MKLVFYLVLCALDTGECDLILGVFLYLHIVAPPSLFMGMGEI